MAGTAIASGSLTLAGTAFSSFDKDFDGFSSVKWKGFSSGKLAEHYQKHVIEGNEFGDISQSEYLKQVKDFAAESNSSFMETKVGNFIVKHDPATRRTFIGHLKDREIRIFYKADFRDADPFQAAIDLAKQLSGID